MKNSIYEAIQAQLAVNKDTNLLYSNLKAVAKVDQQFIKSIEHATQQSLDEDEIEQQAEFAARECLRTIFQLNQYLHIPSTKRVELKQLYIDSWQQIADNRDIEKTLTTFHYPRLQAWLTSLYPPQFLPAFQATRVIKPVLNEQYSPAFQLDLLGIDLAQLKQPILDIGCGSQGRLVRYLRKKGFLAIGIDRMIDYDSDFLFEIDWFDYDFKRESWGSIVSNIAFSNHYRYIRRYESETSPLYACLYANILVALEVNGVFYYAPPAPDLEKDLSTADYTLQTHLSDGIPYAVHIRKNTSRVTDSLNSML